MKRALFPLPAALALAFSAAGAMAGPRVEERLYDPGEVVPLVAAGGVVTTVVFEQGEVIRSFVSGYSSAWSFAAEGSRLYLKPKSPKAATNLTVATDRRIYLFDLRVAKNPAKALYRLTFLYPASKAKRAAQGAAGGAARLPAPGAALNGNWSMRLGRGPQSRAIAPVWMADDGRFTYLRFAPGADLPAAFCRRGEEESIANFHLEEDGTLVIHGVCSEMRLRAGQAVVGLYAEGEHGMKSRKPAALKAEASEKAKEDDDESGR
ncbi:TrbG/VirB9 family P-type conjugative transfer protein [Mesosutterella sp. AGMB02718]|uniref:TrbG/VirB9 family P-type conjugative transfer protein n=1 Tax=Mesosutterella faecium TaxID=2925194 RepID=A0ABT7INT5_9BURK|nr:TrbG/VirB9 family P-type conjugative transfer protein [Mesosutterella sp. AGMB02718]MDL2060038.1 TrbG/VirB9 family P-type conjugative transfer protein [Mesosutterella sp. AGMB02718]